MDVGQIKALATRTARGSPPLRVASVRAITGQGLAGDVHADALSPRQLLLAGSKAYESLSLPDLALRENLLLDVDTSQLLSGTVLQVGQGVLLRLMFQCEACGQLDLARTGLSREIGRHRGMLARVIAGGVIHAGDRVRDLGQRMPAWPDDWRDRVARVLDAVPPLAVIEYRHLARLAGIQSSYCRAFPRVIATLGPRFAGKAVPAQSTTSIPRWEGEGLFDEQNDT
jgi:hypothetical protein